MNLHKMTNKLKCSKCSKKLSFFTSKGFDIEGNLLCGDCWNRLHYIERDVMSPISFKEEYKKSKEHLKAECKKLKNDEVFYSKSIKESSKNKKIKSRNSSNLDIKQILGFIGSVILFIGVFTPIVSVPIVGTINYFQNGQGDGIFLIILAVTSFILSITKKYKGLWLTGVISLLMLISVLISFQAKIAEMKSQINTELAGNPFKFLGDIAVQSMQIQWGWALLFIGSVLIIAAAAIKENKE